MYIFGTALNEMFSKKSGGSQTQFLLQLLKPFTNKG